MLSMQIGQQAEREVHTEHGDVSSSQIQHNTRFGGVDFDRNGVVRF
jgi:hypothetical protein